MFTLCHLRNVDVNVANTNLSRGNEKGNLIEIVRAGDLRKQGRIETNRRTVDCHFSDSFGQGDPGLGGGGGEWGVGGGGGGYNSYAG